MFFGLDNRESDGHVRAVIGQGSVRVGPSKRATEKSRLLGKRQVTFREDNVVPRGAV